MLFERDLLGNSGEPRGESMDYSTELLENSPLSLFPLEAARVAGGGTRALRSDVSSRPNRDPHPS